MTPEICRAMRQRLLIVVNYQGATRTLEPHICGVGSGGQDLLRAYQVNAGGKPGEANGWKLMKVDDILSLRILPQGFDGPRPDYHRGDPAFSSRIYCEL
ncbi:MAG TPA: hypothetical protein VM122_07805 [Usitatibacter sp.]|nr:hypothetical protein [Usitatibacter sp.]